MKKFFIKLLMIIGLLNLVACSLVSTKKPVPINPKTLVANGYSQLPKTTNLTHTQSRYSTEQAAKLNAYRELAKQLYSESLIDGLTVADQVTKDELYRVYADVFLREAKVKGISTFSNQKKVVLELYLSPRFFHCFLGAESVISQCLREDDKTPFTRVGYQQMPVSTVNFDCVASDCSSQLSVSGFSKKKHSVDSILLDYGLYDMEWSINMALNSVLRYFINKY